MKINNYEIQGIVYEGRKSIVYKARNNQKNVILKLLNFEYPSMDDIVRFRREYEITKSIQGQGIIEVYGIEKYKESFLIVEEDFGGKALSYFLEESNPSFELLLKIAIEVAKIIKIIHSHNVIHKDLNPYNILINPDTHLIKIIDFGISTILSKEKPIFSHPNVIEGKLAYISPEQTGRMNRALDSRTDYYSFGVTLYEMFTGDLPFKTEDPLELIYAHIAQNPKPPIEVNSKISKILSDIILKLLKKNVEDRYQTIQVVQNHLEKCYEECKNTNKPISLELDNTVEKRFQIPEKLYGREKEVQQLLSIYDRVTNSNIQNKPNVEIVMIGGYSGIGKTALVQEIYKPITSKKGYYAAGKIDQFKKNLPYSAITLAYKSLLQHLLMEDAQRIQEWKELFLRALGKNAQVIIDVVTELELIIGKQASVPELPPAESQNRFCSVFQKFNQVFCSADHPLVVFLDDLQWADQATLNLLEYIVTDKEIDNLLIIGAFRNNEVYPTHPLLLLNSRLEGDGYKIHHIGLSPLQEQDVNQLVADTLQMDTNSTSSLTELIMKKTNGNPFFINQFLNTLYQESLISLKEIEGEDSIDWSWNTKDIEALEISDNVVDLMVRKLKKLPSQTQEALKFAACLGNSFTLDILSIVCGWDVPVVFQSLNPAIQAGLIVPISELEIIEQKSQVVLYFQEYKFLHDRVQQASYSLIEDANRKHTHLLVGQMLLKSYTEEKKEENIFTLLNHLNTAIELIVDPNISCEIDVLELIKLNLLAARKTKESTAYAAALEYLQSAMKVLPKDLWQTDYDLAKSVFIERGVAEYLNGNFENSEFFIRQAIEKAKNTNEQAEIYHVLVIQYTLNARYKEAIQTAKEALNLVNIQLDEENLEKERDAEIIKIDKLLIGKEIQDLSNLPPMRIPEKITAMKILTAMGPPMYRTHQRLWAVIVAKQFRFCLEYGDVSSATYTYTSYGGLLGYVKNEFKDIEDFIQITLNLNQKYNSPSDTSVAYLMVGSSLRPWKYHLKYASEDFMKAYMVGLESGNLQYSVYAFGHNAFCLFTRGINLEQLTKEIKGYLEFTLKRKNKWGIDLLQSCLVVINCLHGEITEKVDKKFSIPDEQILKNIQENKNVQVDCFYHIMKAQVLYLFEEYEDAYESIQRAKNNIISVATQSLLPTVMFNFYGSLILLALYQKGKQTVNYLAEVKQNQDQMKIWMECSPDNFSCLYFLVEAELHKIENKVLETMNLYDRAIESAKQNDFVQIEAIASELACSFWLSQGKEEFANLYYKKAVHSNNLWMANKKIDQLTQKYKFTFSFNIGLINKSRGSVLSTSSDQSTTVALEYLDVLAVLKASSIITSEIEIEKLLKELLKILLEHAGAQKCFIILVENEQLNIKAQGRTNSKEIETNLSSQELNQDNSKNLLGVNVINYVYNSKEFVLLNRQESLEKFYTDSYIQNYQPSSILCFPLINQNNVRAIIYLENNLSMDTFNTEGIEGLKLLSVQMAISIENALLYTNLTENNRILKEAKEAAEVATLAKNYFLAMITHELRTPMNGVIGNEQLLSKTKLNKEQREYVDAIHNSAQILLTIINDILDFSKIEAGKITLEKQVVDLKQLLIDTIKVISLSAKENNNTIEYEITQNVPKFIEVDAFRLRQVLLNLLSNANKFTKQGKIHIKIHLKEKKENYAYLQFLVEDTGLGIKEENIKTIFESFTQADLSTSRKYGGTGLGLAISKKLIEAMEGKIWVESIYQKGSKFYFYIRVVDKQMHNKTSSTEETKKKESLLDKDFAKDYPLSILLAEDNLVNQKLAAKVLQKLGYKVDTAFNGLEVLESLKQNSYDIILMDIQMPEMDGLEATEIIKRDAPAATKPYIIAMTANVLAEDKQKYMDSGMVDLIDKPIQIKRIMDVLKKWSGK